MWCWCYSIIKAIILWQVSRFIVLTILHRDNPVKLETCCSVLLRKIRLTVKFPEDIEDTKFRLRYTNANILHTINRKTTVSEMKSQLQYISHICRCPNNVLTKKMLFVKSKRPYQRDPWINIAKLLHICFEQVKRSTGWFHYIGSESSWQCNSVVTRLPNGGLNWKWNYLQV